MESERQYEHLRTIRNLEEEINKTFREIPYNELKQPFFMSEDLPSLECESELKFRKMISYLYKLFVERSNGNLKILAEFSPSQHVTQDDILNVTETVHDFRTIFEHYLPPKEKHSQKIKNNCILWYRLVLSKNYPETRRDWSRCFDKIAEESVASLKLASSVLLDLKEKNNLFVFEQWTYRQLRHIPKYRKITILDEIKGRYALNYDSNVLYSRFQKRIETELELMEYEVPYQKMDHQVYCILEKIVLSLEEFPCPVSGREVEEKYNVSGKTLGDLMKKVIAYYRRNSRVHTKETLFAYIESEILATGEKNRASKHEAIN